MSIIGMISWGNIAISFAGISCCIFDTVVFII